jgi:hypothetical protein
MSFKCSAPVGSGFAATGWGATAQRAECLLRSTEGMALHWPGEGARGRGFRPDSPVKAPNLPYSAR